MTLIATIMMQIIAGEMGKHKLDIFCQPKYLATTLSEGSAMWL